jgi:hypothetical protein
VTTALSASGLRVTLGASAVVEECFGPHEYVVMIDGRVVFRAARLMVLYEEMSRLRAG